MTEPVLVCLREKIALRLDRREGLPRVEDQLIEAALGLTQDERAWLRQFAWSDRPAAGADSRRLAGFLAR